MGAVVGAGVDLGDEVLHELLELLDLLLLLGELLLGGLGLVLGGLDLVLERGDLAVELLDVGLELLDGVLELGLLLLEFGDLGVALVDGHLVLAGDGLELVQLLDHLLEALAHRGELGAGVVEALLLVLGAFEEAVEQLLLVAAAGLGLVAVHHRLAGHRVEHIDGAELVAAVLPVVGLEAGLLERRGIFLEQVLHVGRVDEAVLDRRGVLLDLEGGALVGLSLFDRPGDLDEVILLHPVAVGQFGALFVELDLEEKCRSGERQKQVYEGVEGFVHGFR